MGLSSAELSDFGKLVDRIYQGALDPAIWPEVVRYIADWMGAKNALLFTPLHPRESQGLLFSHGFEEQVMELWRSKYQPLDVWVNSGLEKGVFVEGNCVRDIELVPDDELRKSTWYREFLSVYDITKLITGIVFDGRLSRTVPTVCSIFRGERQPGFGPVDVAKYRLIVPHLSRALGVMYRLREPELRFTASLAALDRLSSGVLLLAQSGKVVFANRAARRLLECNDSIRVHSQSDRLVVDDHEVQSHLDRAIQQVVQGDLLDVAHFSIGLSVHRASGLPPYSLQFSSLPEKSEFDVGPTAPRAIVFVTDPAEAMQIEPAKLMELYGLTRAEARLAITLAAGDELQTVAGTLCIAVSTAKTQLQAIYAKTNADNRAKLTKLLLTLATNRAD